MSNHAVLAFLVILPTQSNEQTFLTISRENFVRQVSGSRKFPQESKKPSIKLCVTLPHMQLIKVLALKMRHQVKFFQ
jgi:hypothetical protein